MEGLPVQGGCISRIHGKRNSKNCRILQLMVGLQMECDASRSVTNAGVSLTRAAKVLQHSSTHLSRRQGCHKVARVAERCRILLTDLMLTEYVGQLRFSWTPLHFFPSIISTCLFIYSITSTV